MTTNYDSNLHLNIDGGNSACQAYSFWTNAKAQFVWAFLVEDGANVVLLKLPGDTYKENVFQPGKRVERRTVGMHMMDGYTYVGGIFMPNSGEECALLLHLEKPPAFGRNPNSLHLIRLSAVPDKVETAFSVQATQSMAENSEYRAFLKWKRGAGRPSSDKW